jgi:EpsI family protein
VIGRWKEVASDKVSLVYPQTRELLDKLYSQTLARVYENDRGDRIMLSLAYGEDQRGSLRAHKPEVCYPSQGFELAGVEPIHLITPWGPIAARRLITRQGSRDEPVTYWFVMDHQAVRGTFEQRWVEFRAALEGRIPDGLLFRVSSVDPQASRAFELQEEFAQSLLAAVSPAARRRLAGLGG